MVKAWKRRIILFHNQAISLPSHPLSSSFKAHFPMLSSAITHHCCFLPFLSIPSHNNHQCQPDLTFSLAALSMSLWELLEFYQPQLKTQRLMKTPKTSPLRATNVCLLYLVGKVTIIINSQVILFCICRAVSPVN